MRSWALEPLGLLFGQFGVPHASGIVARRIAGMAVRVYGWNLRRCYFGISRWSVLRRLGSFDGSGRNPVGGPPLLLGSWTGQSCWTSFDGNREAPCSMGSARLCLALRGLRNFSL